MRARRLAMVCAAVLVAAASVMLVRRLQPDPKPEEPDGDVELAGLRRDVDSLLAELARRPVGRELSVPLLAPATSLPAEPSELHARPNERSPSYEEQLRWSRERASQLDDILVQARPDPAWEAETEAGFTRMLAEKLRPNVQPVDIVCRGTMCRIKLEHPPGGGPMAAIDTLQGEPLMAGELYVMVEPPTDDTAAMTTVYVARRGWPLPPESGH